MQKTQVAPEVPFITRAQKSDNTNQPVAPQARAALEQMKHEIVAKLGITLGPDATARQNGYVGGEITKRLVRIAEQQLSKGIH